MPEISVIMPVFNAQAYLQKSIISVLTQSFTDFELILVNDGSTDLSLLFCNSFAKKDNRIRVLNLPHRGAEAARNAGVTAANGKYIAFADSRSVMAKDFLLRFYDMRRRYAELQSLFSDVNPISRAFLYKYDNPAFVFRDESWEHIKNFITSDNTYCWDEPHSSDPARITQANESIEIKSLRKPDNWNCLFYRKFGRYNFELSFSFVTKTLIDEIQVSFNCSDLRCRYRFMIRKCETAVFEVVESGIFHNYIKKHPFRIEVGKEYFVKIIKINKDYCFYIDSKCIFSVKDNSDIKFGGDIALIFYNKSDETDIDVTVRHLQIKTDKTPKTKVGILTYHRAQNYGAFLQAYCLYKKISAIDGIDCEIIDYRTERERKLYAAIAEHCDCCGEKEFYTRQYEMFNRIANSDVWELSKDGILSDSIDDFTDYADGKYDIIICGSDEIWRANSYRGFPTAYWLWGNLHARKVACAVSFGDGLSVLGTSVKAKIQDNLKTFSLITCREHTACDELAKLTDRKPAYLCDPTFTYSAPIHYNNLIVQKTGITNGRKNVLVLLDARESEDLVAKIKTDLGEKYNLLSMFRYQEGLINIDVDSPFEWTEIIKESDFLITNLYHGTVFSILSNTPFLSLCFGDRKEKLLSLIDGDKELAKRFITETDRFYRENIGTLLEQLSDLDLRENVEKNREAFEVFTKIIKNISEETV